MTGVVRSCCVDARAAVDSMVNEPQVAAGVLESPKLGQPNPFGGSAAQQAIRWFLGAWKKWSR